MLSEPELQRKSVQYRKELLQLIKRCGSGHTGGDLSCLDILNVLYNRVLKVSPETFKSPDRDYYIQSKGHCAEALFVVLADRGFFPKKDLETLNRYGSHYIGHPTRDVNGVEQNTGALGHGLAVAGGIALAGKMDRRDYRVYTLLGDGELAEGSNWEAAMMAAHYRLDNLVAIVDRNGLQITGSTEDVCQLSPLDEKFEAFGFAVQRCNGNDIGELMRTFDTIPFRPGKPSLVLAKTRKGKGVSFMENVAKWHHGVPNDEEFSRAMSELEAAEAGFGLMELALANLETFGTTLLELARQDSDLLVVTSDSRGSAKLASFAKAAPGQIVEVGIAEQNLVGVAAGLAAAGKNVFAVSPACFLTARSLEQIKNDLCYSDRPVTAVGISAGVSYGALGTTHHSLHDFAVLRAIHNIVIVAPADNFETREAVQAAARSAQPVYLRFGKKRMPHLPRVDSGFELGRASLIRDGADLSFLACGETVAPAWEAAELLAKEGIQCRVLSLHTLKPLDQAAVRQAAKETGGVITVEEHSVNGGLGEACASLLLQEGIHPRFKIVGFPDDHTVTGSQEEIFRHYGIDGPGLAEAARNLLAKA